MNYSKHLLFSLKLLFASGCIGYVLFKIPFKELVNTLEDVQLGWVLCALGLFLLSKVASAYRLNCFFASSGIRIPQDANLKLYWLGMFYNQFLPGGIGGDVVKTYKINQELGESKTKIAKLVLLDRVSGLTALAVLLLASAAFLLPMLWIVPCLMAIAFVYFSYFFSQKYLSAFATNIKPELYSWIVQLSQFLSALCLLKSTGASGYYLPYLALFLLSSILSVIPATLGGVGIRELVLVLGAEQFQLNAGIAVSIGFLFYLVSLCASLWGIMYVFSPPQLSDINDYKYVTKTPI